MQALHGDIAQSSRERVLKRFREGKTLCLVATDVAARGLDIPNVDLVVHYELPNVSDAASMFQIVGICLMSTAQHKGVCSGTPVLSAH